MRPICDPIGPIGPTGGIDLFFSRKRWSIATLGEIDIFALDRRAGREMIAKNTRVEGKGSRPGAAAGAA